MRFKAWNFDKKINNSESIEFHVNNFINLESEKLAKYKNLYNIYNKINSDELDKIILYTTETQCQNYFNNLLSLYDNQYNEDACEAILLNASLKYLDKVVKYLKDVEITEKRNISKLMKLLAIAYIKTYIHFYVEINYGFFKQIKFDEIENSFIYNI